MAWVCDRPFTTVNFGSAQLSCAKLIIQIVPGDLVVARSVVMAGFGVCEMCMPFMMTKNYGLAVRPRATALTSVSLMGGDDQSQ